MDTIDAYSSELFKRVLNSSKQQRYHYTDCVNLCKQKNIGEKCDIQVGWSGPKYFPNMSELTWELYLKRESSAQCYQSNYRPSDDYLAACDCPLECQTDEYTWTHSSGDVLSSENRTSFEIFYDEMKETVITEEKKTELTDLVATVGGILGLFTGFSFLSLVEVVEIVFQIVVILFKRN